MKHFVITIAREYGSRGAEIGRKLAERLGVEYYDRDLVNEAAHTLGMDPSEVSVIDESVSRRKAWLSANIIEQGQVSEQLIQVQSDIIERLAEKESCVIIGRCANYVLRNRQDVLSILVYAPFEKRVDRIMSVHPELTRRKAVNLVDKMDRIRKNYYYYVSGKSRDAVYESQFMCDSTVFGIDGTVDILYDIVVKQFG